MQKDSEKSVADVQGLLDMANNGRPYSTIDNAVIVFREDPIFSGFIQGDLFRGRIDLTGPVPWRRDGTDISEMDEIHIRHYFETKYQISNDKKIKEGLQIIASENSFHPVREYLDSLTWDGTERIRYVLKHFLGAEVNEYVYEVMKLFLLGAICRVFKPGIKFEYMLCLVGGQGVGKSLFMRRRIIR